MTLVVTPVVMHVVTVTLVLAETNFLFWISRSITPHMESYRHKKEGPIDVKQHSLSDL